METCRCIPVCPIWYLILQGYLPLVHLPLMALCSINLFFGPFFILLILMENQHWQLVIKVVVNRRGHFSRASLHSLEIPRLTPWSLKVFDSSFWTESSLPKNSGRQITTPVKAWPFLKSPSGGNESNLPTPPWFSGWFLGWLASR